VEYVDVGTATRPQLAKLMKAARRHEFEMVLVDRADRWGRDIAHWVVSIQELIKLHVAWTVPSQGLYTDASEYLPMASMIDAMAGFGRVRHPRSLSASAPFCLHERAGGAFLQRSFRKI
jgi:DNA invertase Pin-like site-specific DNA recombinase